MVLFIGNSRLAKLEQQTSDRQNSELAKLEQQTSDRQNSGLSEPNSE